ncbi:cytochrome c3 family protein [Pseudomonas zhanjiangensis]|uniref:nitrite reductase (cytochrome; ammonia-forming) n=1 Tax=Pseudomonas zhanjiangensis TaxID=3239015 RepID=A0ABV3YTW7_9PSED
MKRAIWALWLSTLLALAGWYGYRLYAGDELQAFNPGPLSAGHHQLEQACGACHLNPLGGGEVLQKACVSCHGEELKAAHDAHPQSKFSDPRNADRLAHLDARYCLACHVEHAPERTREMAVTQPDDFCVHCHARIAEERPSHQGMAFATCASAGCHNYHDNRALYEDFLVRSADQPVFQAIARIAAPASLADKHPGWQKPAAAPQADAPLERQTDAAVADWLASAHAEAGVNCSDCHQAQSAGWEARPALQVCQGCHAGEAQGFFAGKHGMRLNPALPVKLTPMRPQWSQLPFTAESAGHELGCSSCHGAHRVEQREAAVQACLGCHADEHSLAYQDSPHQQLWLAEQRGELPPGSGVSCASCHLPRETAEVHGQSRRLVQHNQNANLRPNEKMLRGVCLDCHGLPFALDALADPRLLQNNFQGTPAQHVPSVDMALERASSELHR